MQPVSGGAEIRAGDSEAGAFPSKRGSLCGSEGEAGRRGEAFSEIPTVTCLVPYVLGKLHSA